MNDFLNRRRHGGDESQQNSDREQTEIEQRLGAALHTQADQFEPEPDAYVRLQQRLHHGEIDLREGPPSGPRIFLMAAAVLAVVGIAGYFGLRESGQQVITDRPPAAQSDELAEAASTDLEQEAAPSRELLVNPEYPTVGGNLGGPIAESPIDAAIGFLNLIRITDYAELKMEGSTVQVMAKDQAGAVGNQVAELDIGSFQNSDDDPRFVVTGARSKAVVLQSLGQERITESSVEVTASGTGWFEGQANLRLFSSNDAIILDFRTLQISDAPASIDVALSGRDHGWIVVQAEGVVTDSIGNFAAVPVFFDAPLNPVEYQVAHIPVDDPDTGLLVRHLPGSDERVLDTLPSGTLGIHRRGRVSTSGLEGGFDWWAIEYGDGKRGWVNARYLSRTNAVSEDDLRQVGEAFVAIVSDPALEIDPRLWPAANHKPVQVGWIGGLQNVSAADLSDQAWWADASQEWALPAAAGDPLEVNSLRTFLDLTDGVEVYEANTDGQDEWVYGLDQLAADSNFADLASITLGPPGGGADTAARFVTLYVEQTLDGPVIVGIAVWVWSP